MLGSLPALAGRQRAALESTLGLGTVVAADRFTADAAVLSLLANAAERRPVLVLVDDAQWLDMSRSSRRPAG